MKKKAMMLAVLAMVAGSVQADQKNQVVTISPQAADTAPAKLSADEMAFAAKLTDQYRTFFCDVLSAEQRQAVMVAEKHGASPNDAVAHMFTVQELKAKAHDAVK